MFGTSSFYYVPVAAGNGIGTPRLESILHSADGVT